MPDTPPAAAPEGADHGAFMAEASALLAGSLDYQVTLDTLAHLAVPRLADWCAVDVLDETGRVRRISVAHPDPARERLARELEERYPPDPEAPHGVPAVLRSGEPELVPEIPESLLAAVARDAEHARIIRELGLRSYMVVPLRARGRMLGAITFVSAESGRRFGEDDLALARDLADRAALAVDNARLLRDAEAARRQTERILESITDAFFALDRDFRFTYLNDEAERVLARPRAEVLGRSLWEAFPEAVGSTFQQEYERAVRERRTVEFEEYFPPLRVWLEVRAYPAEEGLSVYFRDVSEERAAARALRDSEERYRFLAESIPQLVWVTRADGYHEYYNQRWYDYTGLTLEETEGEGWNAVLHPDDRERAWERWRHSLATGEPYSIEYRFRRHDGEFRWFLGQALPQRDEEGRVTRWFGTLTDIHDRKTAEAERGRLMAALDAERARLAEIFRDAPAFIAVLRGAEHRFEIANPPYLQLVGHREVVGRTVAEALPEVVEQGFVELLDGVYRGREPFVGSELPIRLQRTPGAEPELHYLNFVYQPMREADGSVGGIFVHGVDVTTQVRARQRVEAYAAERSAMLGQIADGVMIADPQGRITFMNDAARAILGTGAQAAGVEEYSSTYQVLTLEGEPYPPEELPLARAVRRGETVVGSRWRIRRPDGSELVGQGSAAPVVAEDGTRLGAVLTMRDVTDLVRAREEVERKAEELARTAAALEASNRELDQFAYVASHDLKAPLRGIANLSQWIEEDVGEAVLSAETREHLELLRGRVHRMDGLIDGILQYSRAGRVREKVEAVDTGALVAEVLDLLDAPDAARVEVAEGMPTVRAERLPLQQVFMNLVGNALKYARVERPVIRVGWAELGREWEFSVSDNGPGIAPEYHDRIFGIFQTLHARDEVEGTGIGLSLVRKIVESRGGRVVVESEEGRGATFRFRIPREPDGGAG